MTSQSAGTARTPRARPALWACLAAGFATLFDATVITYAAPAVSSSLGGSTAGTQWLLASFSLTFGLGLIPSGRLGDVYGRRPLFLLGLGIFLVGGVAAVAAPTIVVLVAARFVQGLGAGVISAQVLGVIQDLFAGAARLRALAAYTAVGGCAGVLGPVLAAVLLGAVGADAAWRLVLLTPLPLVVAALVLGWRGMPAARHARATRVWLDLPGIVLLCLIVVALTLPVVEPGLSGAAGIGVVVAAAGLAVVLVLWERRYHRSGRLPLFAPALVRSRGFVVGNIVALLWFGSGIAASSAVTLYFLQSPALSALLIALVFAPGALARVGGSLVSLPVVRRLGASATVWIGLGLQATLFAGLAIAAPQLPDGALFVVAAAQIGLGVGGGLVEPVVRASTLSFAPPELHGVAASFLQLTQRLAATFLVALAAGILLTSTGVSTAGTLQTALATCALGSLVAVLASLDPAFRRAGARDAGTPLPRVPVGSAADG
ncbi:MFS transporter [Microbacterium sp. NPDC058389]|uniref:MFS transporter n=1 Tax=Microbacterium sp. NPDC058389 TaxID=3346475 RepID=UPI003665A2E6